MGNIRSANSEIYCLLTVDGDLRIGGREQQALGIRELRGLYDEFGLNGATSWFVNEIDFNWTQNFGDELVELSATGEIIGIHDHLDTHFAENFQSIYDLMKRSRDRLLEFFARQNIQQEVNIHRNGCAHQTADYYRAAIELGYSIVSDVWPEKRWISRMVHREGQWVYLEHEDEGAVLMDNRSVPLGVLPWRHNHNNWLDITSQEGVLLQLPITSMPWIDKDRVEIATAVDQPYRFLLFDIHPYDLQSQKTGEIDGDKFNAYRDSLAWLIETFQPKFLNIKQFAEFYSTVKENL